MDEKKKRGRPPGSKNKPKKQKPERKETYKEESIGMDGIPLQDNKVELRDSKEPFVFVASSCGCRVTSSIRGSGMWCVHKNAMILQK